MAGANAAPDAKTPACEGGVNLLLKADPTLPYWKALAWAFVSAKPASGFAIALECMFNELSPADKLQCRGEIAACRRAKSGELAVVTKWPGDVAPEERTHHLG